MLQIINQKTITIFSRILSVAYVTIIIQGNLFAYNAGLETRIFILMSIFIFSNLCLQLIQKCIANDNLKNAMEIQILLVNISIIFILWEQQHHKVSVIYMVESIFLKIVQEEDIKILYIPTLYIVSLEGYFIKLLAEDGLNDIPQIIILLLLIFVKLALLLLRHHYNNKLLAQIPLTRGQNNSFQSRSPKPINESLIQSPTVENTVLKVFKELYQQESIMIVNFDQELQFCNFDIQKIFKGKQIDQDDLFPQFLKQQCKFSHTQEIVSVRASLQQVITKIRKLTHTKLILEENDLKQYRIVYLYLEEVRSVILHINKFKKSSKLLKTVAQNFLIDMTKSLSHNLGTNLNAIKTYSIYALEDQQLSSYVKDKYIKPISVNSQQLNLFISNIRDLSLIKLDQFDLKLEYFNIKDEIEFVQSLFLDAIERRRIKIINPIIDGQIMSDKNRFRQVYFQMFQNSVKFTEAGMIKTELKLITKLTQQYYYLSVTDTGLGMSKEELSVLQNIISSGQFLRVSKHSVGSGLGICISSLIAKHLSGKNQLQNIILGNQESLMCESLSPGTRIAMILKSYNPDVFAKQNSEKSDSSYIKVFDKERSYIEGMISLTSKLPDKKMSYASINESNLSLYIPEQSDLQVQCLPSFRIQFLSKSQDNFTNIIQSQCCSKVLIADDEVFNIFSLEIILKKYNTIIDTSFNGQEAINKIKQKLNHPCPICKSNFYTLILLDINMPVLDGLQTAQQIKSMMNQNIIPKAWIIANSGFCDLQTKLAAQNAGFDHYLTKPIDQQALEHLLLRLLQVSANQ